MDDLMTLAIDQFSRGIFHMPRSGGGEGVAEGTEEKRQGRKRHRHHHHHHHSHQHQHRSHRHSAHRGQGDDGVEGAVVSGGGTGDVAEELDLPPFFSRASHLYTIAVQVLLLAEKMSDPGSRYRWGRYADSVFGQMRLEENPGPVVVTLARQRGGAGFWGDSPHAVEEERMEVMDVDVDMDDGEYDDVEGEKKEHMKHHKKHGRHHHHKRKHSKHHSGPEASSSHTGSSSSVALVHRPPTVHPNLSTLR